VVPQKNFIHAECDDLEKLHQIHDRRQSQVDSIVFYERLSLAQKFSASQLTQFGFQLQFIRSENSTSFAIFMRGSEVISVDNSGEISTESEIILRT